MLIFVKFYPEEKDTTGAGAFTEISHFHAVFSAAPKLERRRQVRFADESQEDNSKTLLSVYLYSRTILFI